MANGSNGSGVKGKNYVTSVRVQSGDTADLSKNPLKYSKEDSALTDRQRKTSEAFEKKHRGKKIEYGALVDQNGNVIAESRGGKGSVSFPTRLWRQATIMTHVHPRGKGGEGELGGTFSLKDMQNLSEFQNLTTIRASAEEGIYSVSKTANFDKAGYDKYVSDAYRDVRSDYSKAMAAINQDYNSGKYASYADYHKDAAATFNDYLVNLHNAWEKGASKYGYRYTLERWK